MKIQSVMIDGFKNLSYVKIIFNEITALVALNNFGKSNVLSAIDFGLHFMQATIKGKKRMMSNSNFMPMHKLMSGRNYKFEIETLTEFNNKKLKIIYGYEFVWKLKKDEEPLIVSEYLKMKIDDKNQKYVQIINRNKKIALYKRFEKGRCASEIKIEPTELAVNKLCAYDDFFYAEIIKKINDMKFYMENNLDVKSFYQTDPIIIKGLEDLDINAQNLPRAIYHLWKDDSDKFDLLKDAYKSLFPEVEDIIAGKRKIGITGNVTIPDDAPFALTDTEFALFVKNKNLEYPVNFTMMSDGAKRVFMILTKIILADLGNVSLIAIEEPENSVHPGLFQAYLQIISQLIEDCKIIITSHSPYILSYLEPSCIYVGVNRNPGIAEFFTFKKSGKKMLQKDSAHFEMSMGDYLFSLLADEKSVWKDYLEHFSDE